MSFAPRVGREESKDVRKLRAEYEDKAARVRGTFNNATELDKAKAEKRLAHEKMVAHIAGERREAKESLQKVLVNQGTLKTKEQHQRDIEAAKVRAAQPSHHK